MPESSTSSSRDPPSLPTDVSLCDENPLKNLYISSDGEVSPCVYLYPPLPSPFKRIFCEQGILDVRKVEFWEYLQRTLFGYLETGELRSVSEIVSIQREKKFQGSLFFALGLHPPHRPQRKSPSGTSRVL